MICIVCNYSRGKSSEIKLQCQSRFDCPFTGYRYFMKQDFCSCVWIFTGKGPWQNLTWEQVHDGISNAGKQNCVMYCTSRTRGGKQVTDPLASPMSFKQSKYLHRSVVEKSQPLSMLSTEHPSEESFRLFGIWSVGKNSNAGTRKQSYWVCLGHLHYVSD